MKISYESGDLIKEVKRDILEFGFNEKVYAMYEVVQGYTFITNYDFITDERPLTEEEKKKYKEIKIMTLKELLDKLEEQDRIV